MLALAPLCKTQAHPFFQKAAADHKGVVTEILQTTNYTYLHVKENDSLKWLAVPLMQAKAGEEYVVRRLNIENL